MSIATFLKRYTEFMNCDPNELFSKNASHFISSPVPSVIERSMFVTANPPMAFTCSDGTNELFESLKAEVRNRRNIYSSLAIRIMHPERTYSPRNAALQLEVDEGAFTGRYTARNAEEPQTIDTSAMDARMENTDRMFDDIEDNTSEGIDGIHTVGGWQRMNAEMQKLPVF